MFLRFALYDYMINISQRSLIFYKKQISIDIISQEDPKR